jgi:hypothetical protein
MRLRYFQAEDPFAAASARSEQAFSAACLPPVALPGCEADDGDAMSSCDAGAGLARQLLDGLAPQPCEEVVIDSEPLAAFQTAMRKVRACACARAGF